MHLTEEQQGHAIKALATTLGKTPAEIETIISGETPTEVDSLVSERLKTVRNEGDQAGRGKLQKELNKKAKTVFGIETDAINTVDGLVDAVKENYKPAVDPTSLTEEQVKSHAAFKAVEKALSEKDQLHAEELKKATTEAEAKLSRLQLETAAKKALADYGAVISGDEHIAAAQLHLYMQKLEGVTRKEVDGKVEFWKGDKRVETDKLLPVSEEDFFKGIVTSSYKTQVSPPMGSPNGGGSGGQQRPGGQPTFQHFKGTMPKTQEEADKIFTDYSQSPEAIKEVNTAWKAMQQAA